MCGIAGDVRRDPRTRQRGFFEAARVDSMLDEHDRFELLYGHRLWTLFMLEMRQRGVRDAATLPAAPAFLAGRAG